MSNNNILNVVRQYLASHHMFVDEDWITGCVEYLCEDSGSNFTENDIKNLAKEQWLLNDLKDICPGSLPANLKDLPTTVLNGRYVLQINAAIDVGTPAYQQYLKLQKINMENVEATTNYEDKISSHRMIKLYLTDGVQELTAIEYKTMRNLSCDITPGCKMLIKGPVDCRRGMLLLTEGAIELLGGEVQEITISNSLPGLLSSKLGLPMTQASDHNTTLSQPRNSSVPTPHTQMPPHNPQDHHRPVAVVTSLQATFNDEEEIDFDQLADIEAQYTATPPKRLLTNASSNQEKKIRIDPTTQTNTIDNYLNISKTNRKQDSVIDLTTNKNTLQIYTDRQLDDKNLMSNKNTVEDYPDDIDMFIDEDEDYLRELEAKFDNQSCPTINHGPIPLSSEPYVYIKQINELSVSERAGRVFKVKAQIMKLLSKLSVGKDGWSLKCTIVDGSGSIDVEFTSDVLSKLVGFTPKEMNQLKKEMATKPELKEKAVCALQKAKDNLQVLYCIIELTMLEVPRITCLTPFDSAHADSQRKRIEASGL